MLASIRQKLFQSGISYPLFNFAISLLLVCAYNKPLWSYVSKSGVDAVFAATFFIFLVAVFNTVLSLLSLLRLSKPFSIFVVLTAAGVVYFMNTYSVVIDKSMIQNVFETDAAETGDLLCLNMLWYILGLGVVPALLIYKVKLKPVSYKKLLISSVVAGCLSVMVIGGVAAGFYKDYASFFRNNREVRNLIVPNNYLYYTTRYLAGAYDEKTVKVAAMGTDAKMGALARSQTKPMITVVVVGETARAVNFSLNGYDRDTNPLLAKQDIINFPHATSCGTSTAVSVPCMFSFLPHDDFTNDKGMRQENVMDVLQHAGVDVLWRDNNSGCKGVCNRIASEYPNDFKIDTYCKESDCFDPAMLNRLDDFISHVQKEGVIVLHQKGSHGPAYYKRYPSDFKKFTPVCGDANLPDCSQQSIVNAYDNSVLYTDFTLDQVIRFLKKREDKVNSAMIYMSDHGESLGENNVYLHGMPYFMAPSEQTHIPFIVWLSKGYQKDYQVSDACLKVRAQKPVSQDNLVHTLLGFTDVETKEYDPAMDLIGSCRSPAAQFATEEKNGVKAG